MHDTPQGEFLLLRTWFFQKNSLIYYPMHKISPFYIFNAMWNWVRKTCQRRMTYPPFLVFWLMIIFHIRGSWLIPMYLDLFMRGVDIWLINCLNGFKEQIMYTWRERFWIPQNLFCSPLLSSPLVCFNVIIFLYPL